MFLVLPAFLPIILFLLSLSLLLLFLQLLLLFIHFLCSPLPLLLRVTSFRSLISIPLFLFQSSKRSSSHCHSASRPPLADLRYSGKSTIGNDLSEALSLPFIDGDSLHPQSNIDKMSRGVPLTDDDRLPWLALIRSTAERVCKDAWEKNRDQIKSREEGGLGRPGVVIACSALKKWYRDILRGEVEALPPPKHDLVSTLVARRDRTAK
jgi:carbohydrate kinase (thermoresistant glucokinase family)